MRGNGKGREGRGRPGSGEGASWGKLCRGRPLPLPRSLLPPGRPALLLFLYRLCLFFFFFLLVSLPSFPSLPSFFPFQPSALPVGPVPVGLRRGAAGQRLPSRAAAPPAAGAAARAPASALPAAVLRARGRAGAAAQPLQVAASRLGGVMGVPGWL